MRRSFYLKKGRTFREWFINEYMVTNETLHHTDPVTGKAQPIGLGWLDDSMSMGGPSEEDKNYIADTGASPQDMAEQVSTSCCKTSPTGIYFGSLRTLNRRCTAHSR